MNQRVGRVTSCAPQFSNAKAARRGLTRPTAPSSSFLFLLSAVLLATSSLLILRPASAHAQGGVPLWTNRYNGPANSDDFVRAIAVDSSGNVFVTGSSASTNEYPYNFDYATIKYSNAGAPLWTRRYNGPANGTDGDSAIALDSSGNAFVTGGSSNGTNNDLATLAYSNAGAPLWTNRYNAAAHYLA